MFDKWTRAAAAVRGGCDLVIELPVSCSLSSAEKFAEGGVYLAKALSADILGFGCENDNMQLLQQAAALSHSASFRKLLKQGLENGESYPKAYGNAAELYGGKKLSDLLSQPNSTLACEYLRATQKLGAALTPFPVKRAGVGHHDQEGSGAYASASYIRELIETKGLSAAAPFLPKEAFVLLQSAIDAGFAPVSAKVNERVLLTLLRMASDGQFKGLHGASEGIENRLRKAARTAATLDEYYFMIKTKRYPLSRVRRLVFSALIGLTSEIAVLPPQYLRVLALNDCGRKLLTQIKKDCPLPILTKPADIKELSPDAQSQFALECRATDLHAALSPACRPAGLDFTTSPLYMEKNA
jgi:predicted nucleotidyltransferase